MTKFFFMVFICLMLHLSISASDERIIKEVQRIWNASIGSSSHGECVSIFYKDAISTCHCHSHDKATDLYTSWIDDTDENGYSFRAASRIGGSWSISEQEFNEQKKIAQIFIAAAQKKN